MQPEDTQFNSIESSENMQLFVTEVYNHSRKAGLVWGQLPVQVRISYLKRLRLLIVRDREAIAKDISVATGKSSVEAMATEVLVVAQSVRYAEKHAPHALKTRRVKTPLTLFGKQSYVQYKPRGVVQVISPWNFPFQLTMIPMIEALAAGNTVVVKPSEETPLVSARIRRLFEEAGFPEHVVQVVEGGPRLGAMFVEERPDFIHFTGSVKTGRLIQTAAARHLIPTTLELGGKDPMIVFKDANLERAVQGALWGGFANSGQVCMSVERLYVERSIHDAFVQRLVAEARLLRQDDEQPDVGSMTTQSQLSIVKSHIQNALDSGANLVYGVSPSDWEDGSKKLLPMILTNVNQSMELMQEETFGPVLPVHPFDTEEEAIRLANDSRFGLGASVWTADLRRGRRVASQIMAGNVVVNDVLITIANPHLPYGGVKEGGIGRYHSELGLYAFSVQSSVMVDPGKRIREVAWFPYRGKFSLMSSLVESLLGSRIRWTKVIDAFRRLLKKSAE